MLLRRASLTFEMQTFPSGTRAQRSHPLKQSQSIGPNVDTSPKKRQCWLQWTSTCLHPKFRTKHLKMLVSDRQRQRSSPGLDMTTQCPCELTQLDTVNDPAGPVRSKRTLRIDSSSFQTDSKLRLFLCCTSCPPP